MTSTERDKAEYLREHFLEPETRCGTYISSDRKAAWKIMLDMLEAVISICERHKLMYSLDSGSLLGAVRHKGIIPWDDDIDINMPRKDYDVIQGILPKELPAFYFMQTSRTDLEYPISHIKIRDSRTTGIDPYHAGRRMRFNMGIFIDIFPIDGVPDSKKKQRKIINRGNQLRKIRRNAFVHVCKTPWDWLKHLYGFVLFCLIGKDRMYCMRESLFGSQDVSKCKLCTAAPSEWGYRSHETWPVKCFSSYVNMQFEYLTVKVPVGYVEILDKMYGDWRKFVKGASCHNALVLNARVDYLSSLRDDFGYTDSEILKFPKHTEN